MSQLKLRNWKCWKLVILYYVTIAMFNYLTTTITWKVVLLLITTILNWLSYKITFNFNKITTRCFNNFFPKLISSHQPITRANRYNWFKAHLLWVCNLHMQCNLLHVRTIETRHNTRTMKLVISRLCKFLASALTELRRSVVQSLGCLFDYLVKQTTSLKLERNLF